MPLTITLYQIGVWAAVGFCTGAGWALGAWLVSRLTRWNGGAQLKDDRR